MSTLGAALAYITLLAPLVCWVIKVITAKPPPGIKPRPPKQ